MKQVEFLETTYELFGDSRYRTMRTDTAALPRVDRTVERFRKLREVLDKVQPDKQTNYDTEWPGFWLSLERESWAEFRATEPDEDTVELKDWFETECPHEVSWLKVRITKQIEDRLVVSIYPTDTLLLVDLNAGTVDPFQLRGADSEQKLANFTEWLCREVEGQINRLLKDPKDYNRGLEELLPLRERFGKVLRSKLWELTPDLTHHVKDELAVEERACFLNLTNDNRPHLPLAAPTLRQFLDWCTTCYRSAGYPLGDGSDADHYRAFADGRDDYLLDLPLDSASALKEWLKQSGKGGHPWEISRGGNMTHISLSLHLKADQVFLTLSGSALSRSAETIRMATGLWQKDVPGKLVDLDLHRNRITGEDLVGVLPDYFSALHHINHLFPKQDRIRDALAYSTLEDNERLLELINWIPEKEVRPA